MVSRAVINSGPLIALALLNRLDLLSALFSEFWIPDAVYQEVALAGDWRPGAESLRERAWLSRVRTVPIPDPLLVAELDAGEAAVISLARAYLPCVAVIDEKRGRRIATQVYGLQVKGTAGLLVEAYRRGLVVNLRGTLAELKAAGYFLSDSVIEAACLAVEPH